MSKKKTLFSNIFTINIVVVMVIIIILTTLEYTLMTSYVMKEQVRTLRENAETIAAIVNTETSFDKMETFLLGFSKITNRTIIIVNKDRKVLMASAVSDEYNEKTRYIEEKYCNDVLSRKEKTFTGTLGGVFNQKMYTLQIPVVADSNTVIGAIFISTPIPKVDRIKSELMRISIFSTMLVLFLSFLLSYTLSKKIARPIKKIGISAQNFAKGNFEERVELGKNDYNISEINELAENFNNMAEELEKADEIRDNFISDVSHELRTPMTTISGFIDCILDGTIPKEKQEQYLTIVKQEVARLSKLVNTFLDMTRLKNGKMEFEMTDFDINEMIRLTIISLQQKLESKNIQIEADFPSDKCIVKADRDSIKRVITNLLDNAVKFTNVDGTIKITVSYKGSEVIVSVYNTGCGISANEQKMVFEKFYKVDKSRSVNREGTGIGLYIVKDILNHHGKKIRLNSVESEYAEFIFSLNKGKN